MQLEDFDFALPPELIAQEPLETRDASRLLVLPRGGQAAEHRTFAELPSLLRSGDLLVMNDAKVIPARLLGHKAGSGGKAELLLVRPAASSDSVGALEGRPEAVEWICLGQSSKGFRPGTELAFSHGLSARILEARGEGEYLVRFAAPTARSWQEALQQSGQLPLPPYIERAPRPQDADRYQTVYAQKPGSVAAPTAGLHFTPELLLALDRAGIERATVSLDVGPGTFLPVRDTLERHRMHAERFDVPASTAEAVNRARSEGRRVIAVGTTAVRTLESSTAPDGQLSAGSGETSLFIRPGYGFRQVDGLITNFHLPRSTLLMLVSAFAGHGTVMRGYRAAMEARYRFFSYGDAMLVL